MALLDFQAWCAQDPAFLTNWATTLRAGNIYWASTNTKNGTRSSSCLALCSQLLSTSPMQRPEAAHALKHAWFSEHRVDFSAKLKVQLLSQLMLESGTQEYGFSPLHSANPPESKTLAGRGVLESRPEVCQNPPKKNAKMVNKILRLASNKSDSLGTALSDAQSSEGLAESREDNQRSPRVSTPTTLDDDRHEITDQFPVAEFASALPSTVEDDIEEPRNADHVRHPNLAEADSSFSAEEEFDLTENSFAGTRAFDPLESSECSDLLGRQVPTTNYVSLPPSFDVDGEWPQGEMSDASFQEEEYGEVTTENWSCPPDSGVVPMPNFSLLPRSLQPR